MIGFVSAVSSALAIFVLICVVTLLASLDSLTPKFGLKKISDFQYVFIIKGSFLSQETVESLNESISEVTVNSGIKVLDLKPVCNYGFNREEREAQEISSFNYVELIRSEYTVHEIANADDRFHDAGLNYCHVQINLEKG